SNLSGHDQDVPRILIRFGAEFWKRAGAQGQKSCGFEQQIKFQGKEISHAMAFRGAGDNSILCNTPYLIVHRAGLLRYVESAACKANDLAFRRRDYFCAFRGPEMKNGRTIPDVKNQNPSRVQMTRRRLENCKYVCILELISQDCKHHQRNIEFAAQID